MFDDEEDDEIKQLGVWLQMGVLVAILLKTGELMYKQ